MVWLWIDLPTRADVEAHGGARSALLELGDAIGRPGVLAVLAIAAYFTGSLSEEIRRWLVALRPYRQWRGRAYTRHGRFRTLGSKRGEAAIMEYLRQALSQLAAEAHAKGYDDMRAALDLPTDWPVADQIHIGDWEILLPDVARDLFHDTKLLRTRLLATNPALAAEADRFEAESALRLSIVAPASAMLFTLSLQDHLIWIVGYIVVAVLAWQGLQRLHQSADVIADALLAEIVTAPSVDRLAARIRTAPTRAQT
jgi:hypothetical protein